MRKSNLVKSLCFIYLHPLYFLDTIFCDLILQRNKNQFSNRKFFVKSGPKIIFLFSLKFALYIVSLLWVVLAVFSTLPGTIPDPTGPPVENPDTEASLKYCGNSAWHFVRPKNNQNGKCLYFTPTELNFDDQKEVCRNMQGYLVNVNSPDENKYLQERLASTQVNRKRE